MTSISPFCRQTAETLIEEILSILLIPCTLMPQNGTLLAISRSDQGALITNLGSMGCKNDPIRKRFLNPEIWHGS
jgi:hypothetical protein